MRRLVAAMLVLGLGLVGVSLGFGLWAGRGSGQAVHPPLGTWRGPSATAATVPTTAPATTATPPVTVPLPPGSVRCGDGSVAKAYSDCATTEATRAIDLSIKPAPIAASDVAVAQAAASDSGGDAAVASHLGEPASAQATVLAEQATSAAQDLQSRFAAQQNTSQGYTS